MNSNRKNESRRARALVDPEREYASPAAVLEDDALDDESRRRILEGWALDEQRLLTSTGENMGGGRPNRLAAVNAALRALDERAQMRRPSRIG